MNMKKLFILIILLGVLVLPKTLVNAAEGVQEFYRTIETDSEGWSWNGFELVENYEASRSWEHGTFEKGKTGVYRFKGTDLHIIGYKGIVGGSIEVDIDGKKEIVSLAGEKDEYQSILYTNNELTFDWHTLTITSLEDGKWHAIDAIKVNIDKEAYLKNYNLAQVGKIISSVMNPIGGGNHDINVIRNEKIYDVGTSGCGPSQYDSFNGSGKNYFFVGFQFDEEIPFSKLVFQEGDTWFDGGWFANGDIRVEVRQNGIWSTVVLKEDVNYPNSNERKDFGVSCEIYTFTFDTMVGDAIRLIGLAGGSSNFVSIAQIEVYSNQDALTLHGGYDYRDACAFEVKTEEPPVDDTPTDNPGDDLPTDNPGGNSNENNNQDNGCGGSIVPSLIAISPVILVLFVKKRKMNEEE